MIFHGRQVAEVSQDRQHREAAILNRLVGILVCQGSLVLVLVVRGCLGS
jgi:hypothetical protein